MTDQDIFQDIKHDEDLEEKRDNYKRWLYGEDYDSTD